jgi:phosphoribosyl 1,2-cyclic phosphate phosphodiesterase
MILDPFFRQGDIDLYAHKRVFKALEKRFDYIFTTAEKYPGVPSVIEHEITNKPFMAGNINVIPIDGLHHKLQVFGFRFKDFAYLTDMKTIKDEEVDKLQNLDVLVVNALRVKSHISHFNLEEALAFIKRVKPKRAYLTHISHLLGFHDDVQQKLPDNVFLAYDNLQITI